MRVLVNATSAAPGGGATFARWLLGELARLELRDEYVVLVKDDLLERSAEWPSNVRFARAGRLASSGVWRAPWEQVKLRRILRSERCDLLFGIGGYGVLLGSDPQVVVAQNALFYEIPPGTALRSRIRRRIQRWLQIASIKAGASVVCVSEFMRDLVVADLGDAFAHIVVIPHGTDMVSSMADSRPDTLSSDLPTLLWVGVDSPHKNFEDLLHALPTLERLIGGPVSLRMAGAISDSEQMTLLERARTLGMSQGPVFVGHVDRDALRSEYLRATVFVSTSLVESSDMGVLEAMAVGTPVVASDIAVRGAARTSIRTYIPGDSDELAVILADVILNEQEQARLATLGRAYAGDLTWRAAAIQYRAVFVDTIERSSCR